MSTLARRWNRLGVASALPCTNLEIDALEHLVGGRLPPDFTEYLRTLNGMTDMAFDVEPFSFWSAQRMLRDGPEEKRASRMLPFADWLIDSHRYVLSVREEDHGSVWIEHAEPELCAESFGAFLSRYATDALLVLRGPVR